MREFVILIGVLCFSLVGCAGLQLNIPVEVQTLKREEAALKVLLRNKSDFKIKITYPIQTRMLDPQQQTIFSLPKAGNYEVIVTAYAKSKDYHYDYKLVGNTKILVFLDGDTVIRIRGNFVGCYAEVTDKMFGLE